MHSCRTRRRQAARILPGSRALVPRPDAGRRPALRFRPEFVTSGPVQCGGSSSRVLPRDVGIKPVQGSAVDDGRHGSDESRPPAGTAVTRGTARRGRPALRARRARCAYCLGARAPARRRLRRTHESEPADLERDYPAPVPGTSPSAEMPLRRPVAATFARDAGHERDLVVSIWGGHGPAGDAGHPPAGRRRLP